MKRFVVLLVGAALLLSAKWYKVQVPLNEGVRISDLSSFEIMSLKPGYEALLVVDDLELRMLRESGIPCTILIDDMELYYASRMSGSSNFGNYYTLSEAYAILDSLHEKYPGIISARIILPNDDFNDLTWKENHVYGIKVSDNVETDEEEPAALFTGLHHAREPICVNICVEWARWLAENYGKDPLATWLVENREIWIVPIVNPDGYLINETNSPQGGGMHRKNGNPAGYPVPGVDLNRNYPYMWGYDDDGSSGIPQAENFRGSKPASEPETQSIINLCKEQKFVVAVHFHSAMGLFMYPWGYDYVVCEDSNVYYRWGQVSTGLSFYNVIPGYKLYKVNGGADDWMYGDATEKPRAFAVTIEVGKEFWEEPQIAHHVEENFPLLLASAKAAGPYPEIERVWWKDSDSDGDIMPGDTVSLVLNLHNMGVQDPTGDILVSLEGSDSRVDILSSTASIPSLGPQESFKGVLDISLKISQTAPLDSAVAFDLVLSASGFEFVHRVILPVAEAEYKINENFDDQSFPGWNSKTWAITSEDAHSGGYSITDSPRSSYSQDTCSNIVSPKIDLSDALVAEVSFWHKLSTDKGYDWAAFQVRSGSTEAWHTVKSWSGYFDWTAEEFDLAGFCGPSDFQMRFMLYSDSSVQLDGWYVDDIKIKIFKGKVTTGGTAELVDIRPIVGPVESLTKGVLNFKGPDGAQVDVKVFDPLGRKVAETSGKIPFAWDLNETYLGQGTYFIKTISAERETTRKVVFTK